MTPTPPSAAVPAQPDAPDVVLELADKLNSLCVAEFAWPTLNEAAIRLRRYHARVRELEAMVAALTQGAAERAVPAEPTNEMYRAAQKIELPYDDDNGAIILNTSQVRTIWHAMLAAAPAQPAPEPAPAQDGYQPLPGEALNALLDHIYENGTAAEGVMPRLKALCHAYVDSDRAARAPVAAAPEPVAFWSEKDGLWWRTGFKRPERCDFYTAPQPPAPAATVDALDAADMEALRHSANEWADMAANGLQWLRNLAVGASDVETALKSMESNLTYCRLVNDAPAVQRAVAALAAQRGGV